MVERLSDKSSFIGIFGNFTASRNLFRGIQICPSKQVLPINFHNKDIQICKERWDVNNIIIMRLIITLLMNKMESYIYLDVLIKKNINECNVILIMKIIFNIYSSIVLYFNISLYLIFDRDVRFGMTSYCLREDARNK